MNIEFVSIMYWTPKAISNHMLAFFITLTKQWLVLSCHSWKPIPESKRFVRLAFEPLLRHQQKEAEKVTVALKTSVLLRFGFGGAFLNLGFYVALETALSHRPRFKISSRGISGFHFDSDFVVLRKRIKV